MAMDEESIPTGTLGIERWVQFAFIGGALLTFWFVDHLMQDLVEWGTMKMNMATPNPTIVTAASGIGAILAMVVAYRNPKVNKFANEVAVELAQVTWPDRKETWSNTVIVFVVSIIAAVILGVFDAAWSTVTDLIY